MNNKQQIYDIFGCFICKSPCITYLMYKTSYYIRKYFKNLNSSKKGQTAAIQPLPTDAIRLYKTVFSVDHNFFLFFVSKECPGK